MRLHRRFFLWTALVSAAVSLMVGAEASRLLESQLRADYTERLYREAGVLEETLPKALATGDAGLWRSCRLYARQLGVRVTVIDPSGRVVVETDRTPEGAAAMENHHDRPEILQAAANGFGVATRFSSSQGRPFTYVAHRVVRDGRIAGFIRLSVPSSELTGGLAQHRRLLLLTVLLALSAAGLLAAFSARQLSLPLDRLRQSALAMAAGDYSHPVADTGRHAVPELAQAVGRIGGRLRDLVGDVQRERGLLASMVDSIEEGLLLVDSDLQVSFANARVRQIFDLRGDPVGRPLVECVRLPEVAEAFREAAASGRRVTRTLRLRRGAPKPLVLELRVVPYGAPARLAVGLFLDMTRLEALESMRRMFVADVSHELRTPLTAMRAAAETLGSPGSVPPELARFPEILLQQALRMEALLDDLTDLSLIETGAIVLQPVLVEARPAVAEAASGLAAKWEGKAVRVEVELPEDLSVFADRRRFEQVVVNLLDNAIKFSASGCRVWVRGGTDITGTWIEVADEGPGIPPEEQERVFQRFHQVDRSRSKSAPGTGLGLAIVKHLMILHGGEITLRSEPRAGSVFRVRFPPPPPLS